MELMYDDPDAGKAEAFNTEGKGEREETEMDMTPMVDVTFLLLIFFMVTAAFSLQKSLEIPTPKDDEPSTATREQPPPDQDPTYVSVVIDDNNTFQVTTVDWEEEAPGVSELYRKLRLARQGDSSGNIPTKLLVKAHEECLHEFVVSAIDAGAAAGMAEIQLQTITDDDL